MRDFPGIVDLPALFYGAGHYFCDPLANGFRGAGRSLWPAAC